MDPLVNIEMPAILNCLREDVYSLLAKWQLPQEQLVQIGQLIEQIRLEENKYEQEIKRAFQRNNSVNSSTIDSLNLKCKKMEKELEEYKYKNIRYQAEKELADRCNF